jgi:glutamate carboxypeptidase
MNTRILIALFIFLSFAPAGAAELSPEEQRMADWIDAHAEDAIALLEETVNISSGTMNHEGVREVGRVMQRELDTLGLDSEWIDMPEEVNRAGHLFGRKDGKGR